MPFTEATQIAIMNHVLGAATYTPVSPLHLGLSTTTITSTGTNITEPANGYLRVSVTNNTTNFPTATTAGGKAVKASGVAFTFPESTGSWGTVTNWFLSSASTGGTIVAYGVLTNSRTIAANTIPRFTAGSFIFRMAPVS